MGTALGSVLAGLVVLFLFLGPIGAPLHIPLFVIYIFAGYLFTLAPASWLALGWALRRVTDRIAFDDEGILVHVTDGKVVEVPWSDPGFEVDLVNWGTGDFTRGTILLTSSGEARASRGDHRGRGGSFAVRSGGPGTSSRSEGRREVAEALGNGRDAPRGAGSGLRSLSRVPRRREPGRRIGPRSLTGRSGFPSRVRVRSLSRAVRPCRAISAGRPLKSLTHPSTIRTRSPSWTRSTSSPQRTRAISAVPSLRTPFRTFLLPPLRCSNSRTGSSFATVASMVATRSGRRSEMNIFGGAPSGIGGPSLRAE